MGQPRTKHKLLCFGDTLIKLKESPLYKGFKAYLPTSGGKESIHLSNGKRSVGRLSPIRAVKETSGMLPVYFD